MTQIVFNEDMARHMEVMYSARDIVRRRALAREALAPQPGERILDVGCGPGFSTAEIAELVPDGAVVGVDNSETMLAVAAKRCDGLAHVSFAQGDATSLPVDDAYFDAALCVQVLEYVPDATAALREMHRALKPGGRVVVWDIDWGTLTWYSADQERMRRVLAAWDKHLVHPALPRTLAARLREAGFEDVRVQAHPFATIEADPETYGGQSLPLIAGYAAGIEEVGAAVAEAWQAEQQDLDARGGFFYSITQFCFTARRP